jgi:hypothetical protein
MNIPSFTVEPLCNLRVGITRGGYTDYDRHDITAEKIPLAPVRGAKEVFVVPLDRDVHRDGYLHILSEFDLKPCKHAPQYLLGLMSQISERRMPQSLDGFNIIAAEPDNPASVFGKIGELLPCFLYTERYERDRWLYLYSIPRRWCSMFAFLAERVT